MVETALRSSEGKFQRPISIRLGEYNRITLEGVGEIVIESLKEGGRVRSDSAFTQL